VALATQYGATDLRLKRDVIVLAAMVADYLKTFRRTVTLSGFFRPALRASLRRHHVPLIKDLLFLFGEKEGLFTLNARSFDVRHTLSPYNFLFKRVMRVILAQSRQLDAIILG